MSLNKMRTIESSQDSIDEPPHKKSKIIHSQQSINSTNDSSNLSLFSSMQSQKTTKDPSLKKTVIKKGESIKKKIDQLLKSLKLVNDEDQGQLLLMSSGDGIQKMFTIIEILKKRLKEIDSLKLEQFNKLDKYETILPKNEILDKKVKVPVFYCLFRVFKSDNFKENKENIADLKSWTKNE